MRALLCHEHGPPESLRLEEVSDPDPPGEGQVSVRVQACGLNFPDTLIIRGLYQFAPPFPFSPGGEIAGVVDGVGPGVDGLREGDRVFGMTGWGGLAERMLLGADKVVPVPDGMDMDVAAAFTMAYGTTIYALEDRARLTPGQALLVLGAAGGVGLAAVELGRALGADPIVAAASTQEKLDVARAIVHDGLNRSILDGLALFDTIGELRRSGVIIDTHCRGLAASMGAAIVLFALAALIEGFLSPSSAPYIVKAAVAAISTGMLMFYFVILGYPRDDVDAIG